MNRVRPIGWAVLFVTAFAIVLGFACSKKNPIDPTAPIAGEIPLLIDVEASPRQIVVGGGQSVITARLVNQNGSGLAGRTIRLSTNLGTVASEAVSDTGGYLAATLSSGSNAGTATIMLQYGNQASASASVTIISSAQGRLQIATSRSEIFSNGIDTTSVVVTLLSDSLKPVVGQEVQITNSTGMLSSPGLTNEAGQIPLVLTSTARTTDTTAVVKAIYQNDSVGVVILFKGITFSASANPSDILADGKSTSTIQALVKQTSTNIPLADQKIEFGVDAGIVTGQAMTDGSGMARSTLIGTTTPDTAHVLVKYGPSFYQTVNVAFHARTEAQFSIAEMTASSQTVLANGVDQTTISLKVVDAEQKPVQGLDVRLETTAGKLYASTIATDAEGKASTALTADTSSISNLSAVVRASAGLANHQVTVSMIAVQFDVSVSTDTILADGQSTCAVTALLKRRATQVAVANAAVSFGTDRGLVAGEASTGAEGTAQVTLRSSLEVNMVSAQVSARYGAFSPRTRTVVFKPLSAKQYQLIDLSALPNVMLANGIDKSKVSVKVVDESQNPVKGQKVSFTANAGRFVSQDAVSGDDGVASVELIADTSSVSDVSCAVTASLGLANRQAGITFLAVQLALSAAPDTILSDGQSVSQITAVLKRRSSQVAVSGAVIHFGTDRGVIPAEGTTDASGVASVQLRSSSETNITAAHVTAQYAGFAPDTLPVFFNPPSAKHYTLVITATPPSIIADGSSTSKIQVVLKETASNAAVPGATVLFASDLGTIPAQSVTNASGVAEVNLTSVTTPGTANVTARFGGLSSSMSVVFQASVPTYLEVTATPSVIPADGRTASTIQAVVTDASHNPVLSSISVSFIIIPGLGSSIITPRPTSDGIAESALISTNPGAKRIYVNVGGISDSVDVMCTVGEVAQILVTSDLINSNQEMPADGITNTIITAHVMDGQDHPIPGVVVNFKASIGDITRSAITNTSGDSIGWAKAKFSSGTVGSATITASVGSVNGSTIINLIPDGPNSIILRFNPKLIGVRDTGQEKTTTIEAEVRDAKNNPVKDGTPVLFSILQSPDQYVTLSSEGSIPTVNGIARVSLSSGYKSGNVRVRAAVEGIISVAEEILIHAGEPYMENVSDLSTTHLTVAASRLNIWSTLDTTMISIMAVDKFNNPVQRGTAVYLTTSGGGINTHTAYTDEYGKANVLLTAGNPQPTIGRFYNYTGMQDPNYPEKLGTARIPGYVTYSLMGDSLWLPNFDADLDNMWPGESYPGIIAGIIPNSVGDETQNDGIARIIAYTEGQDASGDAVRVWDWLAVVMSGPVGYEDNSDVTMESRVLNPGQYTTMRFRLWDHNGNPIESNSTIKAELVPQDAQAALSWTEINTGSGQGRSWFYITISNNISSEKPKPGPAAIKISWQGAHQFGSAATPPVYISAGTP